MTSTNIGRGHLKLVHSREWETLEDELEDCKRRYDRAITEAERRRALGEIVAVRVKIRMRKPAHRTTAATIDAGPGPDGGDAA